MCPGEEVSRRVSAICSMISRAGRFDPIRSVAMPGQTGLPWLCARHQFSRTGKLWAAGSNAPIKLRREIIDPAFREPFARVGEKLPVGIQPCFRRRRHAGSPDSKRTDPETRARLRRFDRAIRRADEFVDVVAPPIRPAQPALAAITFPQESSGNVACPDESG